MIEKVNKRNLRKFVDFPDRLYDGDANYVPYMKGDLTKTLSKLLFEDKNYVALLSTNENKAQARILLTVDKNKQLRTDKCGFFCMFECVYDNDVCKELLDAAAQTLRQMGAEYMSGTYFPHDPDNRRGILVDGFDAPPLVFTSYNKPYYDELLTNYGMKKQTDALQYKIDLQNNEYLRVKRVDEFSRKRYNYRVDTVDWKNIDRDIADFHTVMQVATNDIIYQDAPSVDALNSIVKTWKRYLNKDYILIARDNDTDKPLGILMALPDYFELFAKMRGRLDLRGLHVFLRNRKKIHGLRAMLQYVVPKYQNTGMLMSMYCKLGDAIKAHGVTRLEAGTIMENNAPSNSVVQSVGGSLARRYRLYYKEI